jgi:hypothetical protein
MGIHLVDHTTPHLYPLKLAPTSPTGGGVGIVHSQTKAVELSLLG